MNKHRQGRKTGRSSRIFALLMTLLMITALIVPIGVRASETPDGSASGASQAVEAESTEEKKAEEKSSEKKEEADSSVSEAPAAEKEESKDSASSQEQAEKAAAEQKEQESGISVSTGSESSSETADKSKTESSEGSKTESSEGSKTESSEGSKTESSEGSKTESSEGSKTESSEDSKSESAEEAKTESAGKSKTETDGDSAKKEETDQDAKDTDGTDDDSAQKDASSEDASAQNGGNAATDASAADDAKSSEGGSADAAGTDAAAAGKSSDGTNSENTDVAAKPAEDTETTITFRTEEVTVIADKKAFDTEVTMKVKKVTDPEQLLKMVTALQEEGGSYTVTAYNVSFYDKDGKEVEPKVPVQVNVNAKVSAPKKSKVVHVKDDDKTEVLDADIDRSGASFELDSFSDIGLATEDDVKIPGSSFDVYLGDELSTEYTVDDLSAGPISEEDLPAVDGYKYENATVGDKKVEEIGTITDDEGNVYVYYTTKDEDGTIKAEILGDNKIRINLVETEKDTSYDLEVNGMHVHVEAPAGAFDAGTYMEIQTVELNEEQQAKVKEQAAEVLGEDASMNIQAVDITFYDKDGQKVQPRESVKVEITTPQAVEGDFCVVHLGDTAERVDAERSDESTVRFDADSFSVYAVVGNNTTLEESRMTLNFYNGSTLIATMYVKNGDDEESEIEQIIYDPGAGTLGSGEMFKGWLLDPDDPDSYTAADIGSGKTVADIRSWAKGLANADSIKEGEVHNIYAMIFKAISVVFKDEDGATMQSDSFFYKSDETPSISYTINVPYTPKSQDAEFKGWKWGASDSVTAANGSALTPPVANDTDVKIGSDVVFTPDITPGHWLIFDENGEGASYTNPQFIATEEVTVRPSDPTRTGYTFGGWYKNAACTGDQFTFGESLTERTTLYAKWIENTTANYTVIVWAENVDGTGYDFAAMQTLTGTVGDATSACLSTSTSGDASFATISGTTYDHSWTNSNGLTTLKGFTYKEFQANNNNTIKAEGTSVLNVYYDRLTYTLKFYYARSQVTGGTPIYERTYLGSANDITGDRSNTYYTAQNGGTQIYWSNRGQYFRYQNGIQYTGDVWQQVQTGTTGGTEQFWVSQTSSKPGTADHVYDGTEGTWIGSNTTQPGSGYGTAGTETRDGYTYYFRTLTAKYGTNISNQWPKYNDTDFERWTYNGSEYRQGSWIVMANSLAYISTGRTQGTIKGKITVMDENILGDLTHINGNYVFANYDTIRAQHDWTYHIYFKDLVGDGYTLHEDVHAISHNAGGNEWEDYHKPPEYPGMEIDRKSMDDSNSNNLQAYFYYVRKSYPIVFMDGQYVEGDGTGIQDRSANTLKTIGSILYEADVTSYNEDEADYYVPAKGDSGAYAGFDPAGYVFAGWYKDAACTTPYTFSTMPLNGITVYAKWIQKQYRVFLHPNVPTDDGSLDWGGQSMTFLVDHGDKIADGKKIEGTRDEYDLIGWYMDEACKIPFNFNAYVLNDSTVTTEYNQTEATTLNEYGNATAAGNEDKQNNRIWVTSKLDLYAKWRAKLEGANGINVVYDPGAGTNAPADTKTYLDNTATLAGAASTPNDTTKQFKYWVVQKWNGTAYEDTALTVYPGEEFTVLKENAKVVVTEWVNPDDPRETSPTQSATCTEIKTATYTVQLRAEYGPKERETKTHIWWFKNHVAAGATHEAMQVNDDLKINQAVTIPTAPTRDGYTFLGWAKVPAATSESSQTATGVTTVTTAKGVSLTKNNLFLKYESGTYKAKINNAWTTVTQVAADEKSPYEDMYAVWERTLVDITVSKVVTGNMGDTSKSFTFEAELTGDAAFGDQTDTNVTLSDNNKTATFSLTSGNSVTIKNVPALAAMSITETNGDDYETTVTATGVTDGSLTDQSYSFTVSKENGTVTFTNKKSAVAPTQLYSGTSPMAVLVAFGLGALLLLAAHHFLDRFRNSNNL